MIKKEKNCVNEQKPLDILVVEDKEENRRAAQEYFRTRSDVHVDFTESYDEGLRKIQECVYAVCLFDRELPRNDGAEPEELGFELAKEATKYAIPWAIITAGTGHHEGYVGYVRYCWDGIPDQKKLSGMEEIPSKKDAGAWKKVYERLVKNTPHIAEVVAARLRYERFTGKKFQLPSEIAKHPVPGFEG